MKVIPRQLNRELRSGLDRMMKENGFDRIKGSAAGWSRPSGTAFLSVWFQSDKWGWDERWGSIFTLQFQVASGPGDAVAPGSRFDRIGYVLEGFEELNELRLLNNAVIARLPGTINNEAIVQLLPDGTRHVVRGYQVDPNKSTQGFDIWLHYYSEEDVREWADYFRGKLLRFVYLFESDTKSAHGLDRVLIR